MKELLRADLCILGAGSAGVLIAADALEMGAQVSALHSADTCNAVIPLFSSFVNRCRAVEAFSTSFAVSLNNGRKTVRFGDSDDSRNGADSSVVTFRPLRSVYLRFLPKA